MGEHRQEHPPPPGEPGDLTSLHLQRARAGEQASLAWVVAHFTPFLRLQARYRVQGSLRRLLDPDDVVDEVWMVALPRIAELDPRDGHCTPVLMRFLATTLLHRVNNHLTRCARGEAFAPPSGPASGSERLSPSSILPAGGTSVFGAAARGEALELLDAALAELEPDERELIVLRAIEQHQGQEVARRLGVDPSTVTRRYQKLLEKLRARLPGSLFDELPR